MEYINIKCGELIFGIESDYCTEIPINLLWEVKIVISSINQKLNII